MTLTGLLYKTARASATARAIRKGPAATGRRIIRRKVYRAEGNATRRALRRIWGRP